ncbi:glycosyltransferase [Vibrio sp. 10N.286.51.C3]|uniref:WecB/TagA/CpsF family glycosyltransferase n=1 Tax=unclassified Vibrio TaxID=2614977 RepID=UPI000D3B0472|nr:MULTISPECIES: WecB/TagA/CpsF family glycosyltransferase [unclassified Vibrio]PTP14234.1 glycosyltransferase [Vibrio sp. 10N.286.51.C3]TKE67241.1 WecB/TagA/CpsF family glycosyltransferase [Vibrio sp. F12]
MKLSNCTVFECEVNNSTMKETLDVITHRINNSIFTQHCVVNVAKIVNMQSDQRLKESVTSCDVVNIDGMGVVWGGRLLGCNIPERVAGIDLYSELISLAADNSWPVYFLGASDNIVRSVVEIEQSRHPDLIVAGFNHGYFGEDEKPVVEDIRNSGARLLFVAITSPKKENFINKWKGQLNVDFVMGVGGTFDVIAGKVNRAPVWMQKSGLEWLYRVLQEPKRMAKRYFVTNSMFILLCFKARFNKIR